PEVTTTTIPVEEEPVVETVTEPTVPTGPIEQGVDTTALPEEPPSDGTGWRPDPPAAQPQPQPQQPPAQQAPPPPPPAQEQPPAQPQEQAPPPQAADAQYGG
ncbi:MAG TPA: hypothetical protein VF587_12840, partial [Solirubrobacteraceae bacterium]